MVIHRAMILWLPLSVYGPIVVPAISCSETNQMLVITDLGLRLKESYSLQYSNLNKSFEAIEDIVSETYSDNFLIQKVNHTVQNAINTVVTIGIPSDNIISSPRELPKNRSEALDTTNSFGPISQTIENSISKQYGCTQIQEDMDSKIKMGLEYLKSLDENVTLFMRGSNALNNLQMGKPDYLTSVAIDAKTKSIDAHSTSMGESRTVSRREIMSGIKNVNQSLLGEKDRRLVTKIWDAYQVINITSKAHSVMKVLTSVLTNKYGTQKGRESYMIRKYESEKKTHPSNGMKNVSKSNQSDDVSFLLYTNLNALSSIADLIDDNLSQTMALEQAILVINAAYDSISHNIDSGFESISELQVHIVASEAQALAKHMIECCHDMKHKLRLHKTSLYVDKELACMNEEGEGQSQLLITKLKQGIDEYEAVLDSKVVLGIEAMRLIHDLILIGNSTSRELKRTLESTMNKAAQVRTKVLEDAAMERSREGIDINKVIALGDEYKKTALSVVDTVFHHIESAFKHILTTKDGQWQVYFATVISTALILSLLLSKEIVHTIFSLMQRILSTPKLVRRWGKGKKNCQLPKIILPCEDEKRVINIITAMDLRTTRRAPLRNLLIYGPSGVGKSSLAEEIVESVNGCAYAIMSGADIVPLGKKGPSELQKVIEWAKRGNRPGIIIIDDAECAFGRRVKHCGDDRRQIEQPSEHSSSNSCDILNMFLSLTGGNAEKFSFILTTSNPALLDEAILDRCDELLLLDLPSAPERLRILKKIFFESFEVKNELYSYPYMSSYLFEDHCILPCDNSFDINAALYLLSKTELTDRMSGRELSMIIKAVKLSLYSSDLLSLNEVVWKQAVESTCKAIREKLLIKS